MHGIEHVDFLCLESIHFLHESLFSGEIFNSFIGSLLLGFQLENSGIKKLLLCKHFFLLVNRLHHVGLGLAAHDRET